MRNNRLIGNQFEQLAADYLCRQGLILLQKNYFSLFGEIDLIMQDQQIITFVEVRGRQMPSPIHPKETIHFTKQKKIIRTAQYYLQDQRLMDKVSARFDVVTIELHNDQPNIIWTKNAF